MTNQEELEFSVNEEWAKARRENPWLAFVPEFATGSDGQNYVRGSGRKVVYRIDSEDEQGNQTYVCDSCNGEIMTATVAHSIHDGPFPNSGSGRCHYESVPYCPQCEEEPDLHGSPIRV